MNQSNPNIPEEIAPEVLKLPCLCRENQSYSTARLKEAAEVDIPPEFINKRYKRYAKEGHKMATKRLKIIGAVRRARSHSG